MLRLTPSKISPELARQDWELAGIQYRTTLASFNALDADAVGRFRAARDRREVALENLLATQASA